MNTPYPTKPTEPIRVTLSRVKGWKSPENTVKVSRPTKWGNPFAVGGSYCLSEFFGGNYDDHVKVVNQSQAVDLFQRLVFEGWPRFKLDLMKKELQGKNLACWCKPDTPCHADVLLKLANDSTNSPQPR